METRHRILSMTDGVPDRLICASCGSVHKFRRRVSVDFKKASSKTISQIKTTARAVSYSNFQALIIAEQATANSRPYGQGVSWEEGMWMDHPTFGLGKVQHKSGRKIDVLFQDGKKTLVAL
jgi:hypothetical protein